MPYDSHGEFHVRGAASMGGNASRIEQRFGVERDDVDMSHRFSRDGRDESMNSYRPRPDDSPRSAQRYRSEVHRDVEASSPRYEREHTRMTGDSYRPSPRSPIRTRSPPNMRHSFRPERRDPSPTYDSYRPSPGPRRPDPIDDHRGPPRRPSPIRRSSALSNGHSSPAMTSRSPPTEEKDPRKRMPLYRNATWTKPTAPLPTATSAKVEFNGVKDVPSAPAKTSHQAVSDQVKRCPHIFISSQHLPALTKTMGHLKTYLRQHQPIAMYLDDSGYYLKFPDTPQGKLKLEMCRKAYDGKLLFSSYMLVMQAFVDGQPADHSPLEDTAPKHPVLVTPETTRQGDGETILSSNAGPSQSDDQAAVPAGRPENGIPIAQKLPKTIDPRLHKRASQPAMSDPAQPEPPFVALEDDAIMSTSRSSPPRGSVRPYLDDGASSVSGRTSEASTSGKTCHVCKKRSELDTLVRCSTCPRRYHRYCHQVTKIPADPGPVWQCQRCCRMGVPPKRTLNEVNAAEDVDIPDHAGTPPAKKIKLSSTTVHAPTDVDNATSTNASAPPIVASNSLTAEMPSEPDNVAEDCFSTIIATSIGNHIGKDDFMIPSGKSAKELGTQCSMQLARALNTHPSLDRSLRREVSGVISSRLAADRTILKELISGKSNIDMLIVSSCTPAKSRKHEAKTHTNTALPVDRETHIAPASALDETEDNKSATSKVEAAPAASNQQTLAESALKDAPSRTPPTEADNLVEQAFACTTDTDKTSTSDSMKKPGKLNLVRRKVRPDNLDDGASPPRLVAAEPSAVKDYDTMVNALRDGPTSKKTIVPPCDPPIANTERDVHGSTVQANKAAVVQSTTLRQEIAPIDPQPNKRDSIASPFSAPDRRMKAHPSKHTRVDCAGCGKVKVPRNPSGRMLCVQCKQGSAAKSPAAEPVESSILPSAPGEPAWKTTLESASVMTASGVEGAVSANEDDDLAATDNADDETLPNSQSISKPTCEDCKRRHRRCDHRTKPLASAACDRCRKRHIRCEHGNTKEDEEDDLDFWSTKTTLTCERCGGTHDPKECPVQSFPVAAEALSASDQLFAVIESSQERGLWAKGSQSGHAVAGMQAEKTQDVDDGPHSAIGKSLSQGDAETARSSTQPRRTGIKRPSQRRAAVDEYDLGDASKRPKGTFPRLIGMALCEATGHRLDPTGATNWVAENIPGYDLSKGTWVNSLKATMILNSQGKSGVPRAKQVIEGGRKLYEMLPDMIKTHERWDRELQRPVAPEGVEKALQVDAENDTDDEDSDLEDTTAFPSPPRNASQTRTAESLWSSNPLDNQADTGHMMDVDHDNGVTPTVVPVGLAGVYESSEDEPLAARGNDARAAPEAPTASMVYARAQNPPADATRNGSFEDSADAQSGVPNHLPDELLLRALVRNELENQEYSARSLEDEWPDLHPDFQMDRRAKVAEIQARPRRKQIFGKPPLAGSVNDLNSWQYQRTPFEVLRPDPFPRAHNNEEEDGTRSRRCKTLEDFLGVPDDLELQVLDRELVYRHRNGRVRTVYKTGI